MSLEVAAVDYIGDGGEARDLNLGLSGTPQLAMVIQRTGTPILVYKYWSASDESKRSNNTALLTTNGIRELIDGGITVGKVGGSSFTNHTAATYTGFGLYTDDEAFFKVGAYTGNGDDGRDIQVGFQPDFVFVSLLTGSPSVWFAAKGGDNTTNFFSTSGTFTTNNVQSVSSTAFEVGTAMNGNLDSYVWFALKEIGGGVEQGSYVGDGNTGRTITTDGISVKTDERIMFIKREKSSGSLPAFGHSISGTTAFLLSNTIRTDLMTDVTKTDAFDIEDHEAVNDAGAETYHYLMAQSKVSIAALDTPGAPGGGGGGMSAPFQVFNNPYSITKGGIELDATLKNTKII